MAKNNRKRILCIVDNEEQVVYGTIRYEPGRDPDDSFAVITDETCDDTPIRISEWAVLQVTDAKLATE